MSFFVFSLEVAYIIIIEKFLEIAESSLPPLLLIYIWIGFYFVSSVEELFKKERLDEKVKDCLGGAFSGLSQIKSKLLKRIYWRCVQETS